MKRKTLFISLLIVIISAFAVSVAAVALLVFILDRTARTVLDTGVTDSLRL